MKLDVDLAAIVGSDLPSCFKDRPGPAFQRAPRNLPRIELNDEGVDFPCAPQRPNAITADHIGIGAEFTPPPGWQSSSGVHFRDFGEAFGGSEGQNGFSDFFESLFGRRGAGRAGATFRTRGEDIEAEIFDLGLGHLYRRYTASSAE